MTEPPFPVRQAVKPQRQKGAPKGATQNQTLQPPTTKHALIPEKKK